MSNIPFDHRVAILGVPNSTERKFNVSVAWNDDNVGRLKALGFNTIQINVAWGSRPGDEPLNLEDVVELPSELRAEHPQPVPLRSDPARRGERRRALYDRIELCKQAGLRTIFHYGAPYNAHARYGDGPPNCISNEREVERNALLLDVFASEFPGVDDILVYTYDQDAWLCSEFGPCSRCLGVPLHERLTPFLERLAATWHKAHPDGQLWWEPWELSAGQALKCVESVSTEAFGLALHSNIAEVMSTLTVDRWLKNTCELALRRAIPVIVEYFLGGASEELEPYVHLSHPLVTLRGLRSIAAVPGVVGIKEYYGLAPDREDPNLRMTSLFFSKPEVADDEALLLVAEPYGKASGEMVHFWQETSSGMEFFPWDTSWYIREIGRSRIDHSLSAAMLRGQQAHTPSWFSTRRAIFMKTDNQQPDPWMLEDVQLRCQLAADRWNEALKIGRQIEGDMPDNLASDFQKNIAELDGLRRRALAYAYHLRETNLAVVLRKQHETGQPPPGRIVLELASTLQDDLANCRAEGDSEGCGEIQKALDLLGSNVDKFLQAYFREEPDRASKGYFSVTSR